MDHINSYEIDSHYKNSADIGLILSVGYFIGKKKIDEFIIISGDKFIYPLNECINTLGRTLNIISNVSCNVFNNAESAISYLQDHYYS